MMTTIDMFPNDTIDMFPNDTIDMFPNDTPVHGPRPPERPPTFFAEVAARKARVAGWKWFASRIVGEGPDAVFIVTGGVPRMLKSGPNKGAETWDRKAATEVAVTRGEIEAAASTYERATGHCRNCAGEKVHMVESNKDYVKYGRCFRCKGTGKPTP